MKQVNDDIGSLGPVKELQEEVSRKIFPQGLMNLGNMSFVNASVQSLFSCFLFMDLLQKLRTKYIPQDRFPTIHTFLQLISSFEMLSGSCGANNEYTVETGNPYVCLLDVLKYFKPDIPSSKPGSRQDVPAFLSHVLNTLNVELLVLQGEPLLDAIFGGKLRRCRGNEASFERFLLLPLAIFPSNVSSLESALHLYFLAKPVEENKVALESASESAQIETPPKTLIVQLERFVPKRNRISKITKFVSFCHELDLGHAFLVSSFEGLKYELVSTIIHTGKDVSKGHYTTYRLHSNGQWLLCDDSSVTVVDRDEVLKGEAYILIYQRV